ncbi:MAG: RagB/SusD family nutrient uptake outer membrane protein [Balneolales bacterium]
MKNYIKHIFIGLTLMITLSFCSDEFLSLGPEDTLTEVNFYQTEDDAQAALHGVYNRLSLPEVWGNWANTAEIEWGITGDMYEMDRSQSRIELHTLRFPASNTALRNLYQRSYEGVARANSVIEQVSAMEDINSDTQEDIIAQAKYLRGMFYYNLAWHFGGVPLVLEELDASADFDIPRASREKTWEQIIKDFSEASEVLPLNREGEDVGRATKTAAWGFLVKSYLHLHEYDDVITYSEMILDTKKHDLISNYRDVFREENENNIEILFSTQFSGTEPGRSNIITTRTSPRGGPGEFVGSSAWSNYVPATHWVDDHETDEDDNIIDQRYHETIIGAGEKHQDVDYSLPEEPSEAMTMSGYIITKYWFGIQDFRGGNNTPIVRLPEILLAYAEALNETGDQPNAMRQVNLIRDRAGLDDKSINLSQEEVLDAIFHEYRFEFLWEPTGGFSALNRRGRFLEYLEENHPDFESLDVDNKPWLHTQPILFPIPSTAYDNNKALEQNPHYPPF